MPPEIAIRFANKDDFDGWLPLWLAYNEFYGRCGETALAEEVTWSTWTRFHDIAEPVRCMIAESEGRVIGIVHFIFHRTTISIAPTCYLQDLYTIASERGRGVGRKLIAAVYEEARAAGSARVYWLTHETNTVAMKLYGQVAELSGFVQYRKSLI